MPQPVLETAGAQSQLREIGCTGRKAGVNVDIVCILVEVNCHVSDQSTDRCHVRGEQHGPPIQILPFVSQLFVGKTPLNQFP